MKEHIRISILMTIVTTMLFGLAYPALVTGLAQLLFPARADGSLIVRDGQVIGSRLIGQPFSSPGYFWPRPLAAGNGYDGLSSGGSNLAPTNHQLLDRVKASVQRLRATNPGAAVPVDLVTASGSGLDPDISPAAADFQVPRVARERHMSEAAVREIVRRHTKDRTWGIFGEPRTDVLELNLDLDAIHPMSKP